MVDIKYATHNRTPFFEIAKKHIKEGDKVLDIGAGNGEFADYCQLKDIFLYDGNPKSINNLITKNFTKTFLGQLPVLPFENGYFDLIHISHVVEHLQPQELYESLMEMDRCCKTGGRIVISAPLLWEGFYDDLSHVRPYNPHVFQKYLCGGSKNNLTRLPISTNYKVEEMVYRFKEKEWVLNLKRSKRFKVLDQVYNKIRPIGFEKYNKTGYTIVLKKQV